MLVVFEGSYVMSTDRVYTSSADIIIEEIEEAD